MNRRLEFAVEDRVEEMLVARGVKTLHAKWRKTLKNAPVSRLFDSFGFSVLEAKEDVRVYELALPLRDKRVHQINIKGD